MPESWLVPVQPLSRSALECSITRSRVLFVQRQPKLPEGAPHAPTHAASWVPSHSSVGLFGTLPFRMLSPQLGAVAYSKSAASAGSVLSRLSTASPCVSMMQFWRSSTVFAGGLHASRFATIPSLVHFWAIFARALLSALAIASAAFWL